MVAAPDHIIALLRRERVLPPAPPPPPVFIKKLISVPGDWQIVSFLILAKTGICPRCGQTIYFETDPPIYHPKCHIVFD